MLFSETRQLSSDNCLLLVDGRCELVLNPLIQLLDVIQTVVLADFFDSGARHSAINANQKRK